MDERTFFTHIVASRSRTIYEVIPDPFTETSKV